MPVEARRSIYKMLGPGMRRMRRFSKKYLFDSTSFVLIRHSGLQEPIVEAKVPITVKALDESHLEEVARLNGAEYGSALYHLFQKRFRAGDDCFGAYHEGELVCMGWGLHHEDYFEAYDLTVRPAKGEVVLSGAVTAPRFRGLGIRQCLLGHQVKEFCDRGLRCIGAIDESNLPSLRAYAHYDFKRYRSIRRLRIFGVRVY
jgi:GNAT superfamily N-acetyltransferase